MALLLDVPAHDETQAKLLGAVHDRATGKWYAISRQHYRSLSKWFMTNCILCDTLYLVEAPLTCSKCGHTTKTIWFYQGNAYFKDTFDVYQENAIKEMFNLPYIPDGISRYLVSKYRVELTIDKWGQYKCRNRCTNCGSTIGISRWLEKADSHNYPENAVIYPIRLPEDIYVALTTVVCGSNSSLLKSVKLSDQSLIWE